jgi:hypothetical protein
MGKYHCRDKEAGKKNQGTMMLSKEHSNALTIDFKEENGSMNCLE